jgi:signal transduction histidine kinase/ActR/RegA family two-component response regulator
MRRPAWLLSGDDFVAAEKQSWRCLYAAPSEAFPDRVLDFAVKSLFVASGDAVRVGLWPAGELTALKEPGRISESRPGPVPEQWKYVDLSLPFLREALQSRSPILSGPGVPASLPHFGPLVGTQRAVWLPIRVAERLFGLAMVAYAGVDTSIRLDRLSRCADEIAAALAICRDRLRLDLAGEEMRCQVRISHAILSRDSVQSIFSRIVQAARFYAETEFVVLGTVGPQPILEVAGEISRTQGAAEEGWFSSIWQAVEREGCVVDLGGAALTERLRDCLAPLPVSVERVVALPVKIRDETSAVLIAGLRQSLDSSDARARLAQYVALAAMTLEREERIAEAAEWTATCHRMIENSAECLLEVNARGFIARATWAARQLLHFHTTELATRRLEDLFDLSAREAVTQWREGATFAAATKSNVTLEAPLLAGNVAQLRLHSQFPSGDDASPHSLIHLEKVNAEKNLIESGDGLAAILVALVGAIDSGVLLLDGAGNIRMVSDRFGQIMGSSSRHLFGLGTMDALVDHLSGQFNHPAETAVRWHQQPPLEGESLHAVLEMVRPSAKLIERVTRPLIGNDGRSVGRMEVYRDITRERMVQSKTLQTEKMAALGLFVSGFAHELNSPLTSIQGYAQLLSTRMTAAERMSDVHQIAQEAQRAGGIVKNLLLFARETKPERSLVDLNEIVKRTLALRSYDLHLENILVDMDFDPDLPPTLADAGQLQQVILNLLVNSEHAIRQEGRKGRIGLATRRLPNSRILFEVTDDGPGIPPDAAARIFDPFFTTKPAGVGTGLGLSIVYGIVQEHGGDITVESVAPHGTAVRVELTASLSPLDSTTAASVSVSKAGTLPFLRPSAVAIQPERILVIEDKPTVARLFSDILRGEGYAVDVLLDSREGLERLRHTGYALTVCDLKMPHVDGPAIFRELCSIESEMRHRLLFVTGDTLSPRTLEFLNASGVPYLAKPFLVEELKQIVRQTLASISADQETTARFDGPMEIGRRS